MASKKRQAGRKDHHVKKSWIDYPVTEAEAEVWRLRFDPNRLLTITQIVRETGHGGTGILLLSALRRLKSRGTKVKASLEEQELIRLALETTKTSDLEAAYQTRNLQVRRFQLSLRHKSFHKWKNRR